MVISNLLPKGKRKILSIGYSKSLYFIKPVPILQGLFILLFYGKDEMRCINGIQNTNENTQNALTITKFRDIIQTSLEENYEKGGKYR